MDGRRDLPSTADILGREGCAAVLRPADCARSRAGHAERRLAARGFFYRETCSSTVSGRTVRLRWNNALSYQRIEVLNGRLAEEKVYLEDESARTTASRRSWQQPR